MRARLSGTSSAAARLAAASTSPSPSEAVIARATRGRRPRSSDTLALAMFRSSLTDRRPRRQDDIRQPRCRLHPWRSPSTESSSSISPRTSPARSARRSSATWAPRSSRSSDPGRGDDARAWAPPCWGTESATFMAFNRNKRSLALDLKREGGLEVLRRLVARADVFVQSLRPGAIGRAGTRLPQGHRAQSAARLLLDHRLRHARSARAPAGLRPADAGVRRPDVGERPSGTGAGARRHLHRGHGHRHVGRARHHGGAAPARRHRPRGGGDHRAVRDRADVGLVPRDGLPGLGRGPAAAGLGHRDDRALPGVAQRRRLRDDRRRLGRAVRAAHRGARRARARSRSALRGQSLARDPSRRAGGDAVRADPHAHDQPTCSIACAPPACPPRRSTRWTRC